MNTNEVELVSFKISNSDSKENFQEAIQGPAFKWTETFNKDGETYVKLSQVYDYVHQRLEFDRSVR